MNPGSKPLFWGLQAVRVGIALTKMTGLGYSFFFLKFFLFFTEV